jgi:hypothetical protein
VLFAPLRDLGRDFSRGLLEDLKHRGVETVEPELKAIF